MKTVLTTLGISLLVLAGCAGQKQAESNFIQENIDNAVAQETIQTDIIEKSGKILNPRTIDKDGNIVYVPIDDWCSEVAAAGREVYRGFGFGTIPYLAP